ncbi:MAG TPA: RNA polymerase sigma-70 factor [Bacteroidia bacterium]|nr:RNA polymerase sigma-70 factor [Bacteroidia bacterium]
MINSYLDEKTRLQALQDGDEKAMESLFREFYQSSCAYANTFLHDIDESEEVVQQLFINLWEKRTSLKITGSFQAYLYKAVRNACLNKLKHEKVKKMHVEETLKSSISNRDDSINVIHKELEKQIFNAIESLPEQCRLIFKMSRFEELKYSEIADQLNLSIKTIENQMGKALRIMREKLKDYLVLIFLIMNEYL